MQSIIVAAIAALSSTGPAMATGPELWGGIKAGITLDEALAQYPKRRLQLNEDCKLDIEFQTDESKDQRIKSVRLAGYGFNGCGPIVLDGLRSKYGEPIETTEQIAGRMKKNVSYRFETAVLTIRMTLNVNNPAGAIPFGSYDVIYASRDQSLEAASKL